MNENDLRDCFAMFGMVGLIMAYKDNHPEITLAERAYSIADAMLQARKIDEEGIVAIKKRVNRKVKNGSD
jgi:hypothetical protein